MSYTIQLERIQFHEAGTTGSERSDGAIWFLLLRPCEKPEQHEHACQAHPGMTHRYERMPFSHNPGAHSVPWGWDGNRDAPTIHGSLGAFPVWEGKPTGRDYNAHLHVVRGRIELCADATVILHPNPEHCTQGTGIFA